MDEVNKRLAHNLDDMLLRFDVLFYGFCSSIVFNSCKWNGLSDECNDFEVKDTDVGLCYTFNGDEVNFLKSRKTGL